jgi:hypothetical protein
MNFAKHSELRGKHSRFAPSQPYWLNYTEEDLYDKYISGYATDIGTAMHDLAETLITNRVKLNKADKKIVLVHLLKYGIPNVAIDIDRLYSNFATYVNDAIGYCLTPEQPLFYSENCFGTADAISFRDKFLRIHDYKSGTTPAKMEQLLVYAALFCLEYDVKPGTIETELRIYQNDEIIYHNATAEDILPIMDTIVHHDKIIRNLHEGV